MSTRTVVPSCLLLFMLGTCTARAQDVSANPDINDNHTHPVTDLDRQQTPLVWPPQAGPVGYITYDRPCCCGPIGSCGPITMELYLRTGPSIPVAGGFLAHALDAGWTVEGGGRTMFFNAARDAAWNVDIGVGFIANQGGHPNLLTKYSYFATETVLFSPTSVLKTDDVSVSGLYRTFVEAGIGREWWMLGSADCGRKNWRIGADVGVHYGVARLDLHDYENLAGEFQRSTHVLEGGYIGVHTDWECPCNCCTFLGGLRAEWADSVQKVLRNTGDEYLMDVTITAYLGVRY